MWVCVIELLSPMPQGCVLLHVENTEDPYQPFWPAFLLCLSLSTRKAPAKKLFSRAVWPIRSHSHLSVCSHDDQKKDGDLRSLPWKIDQTALHGYRRDKVRKKKREREKKPLSEVASCWDSTAELGLTRVASTTLESSKSHPRSRPRYLFVTRFHYHTVCIYQIFR